MAPAYKNLSSGQTVVSDEPRPDLEELARWEEIPMPEPEPPAAAVTVPTTPVSDPATAVSDPATPVVETPPVGVGDASGDPVDPPVNDSANGDPVDPTSPVEPPAAAVTVPDETWTDEALDALAKERGITYRSNASKATKVAKLTAPAAE